MEGRRGGEVDRTRRRRWTACIPRRCQHVESPRRGREGGRRTRTFKHHIASCHAARWALVDAARASSARVFLRVDILLVVQCSRGGKSVGLKECWVGPYTRIQRRRRGGKPCLLNKRLVESEVKSMMILAYRANQARRDEGDWLTLFKRRGPRGVERAWQRPTLCAIYMGAFGVGGSRCRVLEGPWNEGLSREGESGGDDDNGAVPRRGKAGMKERGRERNVAVKEGNG